MSSIGRASHRQRRRVLCSLRGLLISLPHSGHVTAPFPPSTAPSIEYQHLGHRLRPRERSQNRAQSARSNPNPASVQPSVLKTQSQFCGAIEQLYERIAEKGRNNQPSNQSGGMGLISGRKAFERPMNDGVELLNAIQDVYLDKSVTVA